MNFLQHFFQNLPMLSIFFTTESAMIAKRFLRMTRIRPSPGILFTLLQHRLETDSSLKVKKQLKSGSLFAIMFWFDRKLVFSSVSIFGISISSQVLTFCLAQTLCGCETGPGYALCVHTLCHAIVLLINQCKCKKQESSQLCTTILCCASDGKWNCCMDQQDWPQASAH